MTEPGIGVTGGASPCPSCGALPVGEFPDCQEMFDHLLARSFSDLTYGRFHRLFVDLYSLQHPDEYCASAKSFAAHLTGLCCVMEHSGAVRVNAAVQRWLSGRLELEKPAMPTERGKVTIAHLIKLEDVDVPAMFDRWCETVWSAYSDHHELARCWIATALGG